MERPARVSGALDPAVQRSVTRLLRGRRWVALATARDGVPLGSWVAWVADDDLCGGLLHLSRLAAHTRNLLANPQASLAIGEPDDGRADPQTLARVTLDGRAEALPRDGDAWRAGRARYLAHLPEAAPRFGFADFVLFRFAVTGARFVGGFANARSLAPETLRAAAASAAEASR